MPGGYARHHAVSARMSGESVLLTGYFRADQLGASYERAFQSLGHPVHRFDIGEEYASLAWPARNRIAHRLTIRNLPMRRAWSHRYNQGLLDAATRCRAPWVFLHNGVWVMPETIHELRKQGRKVAIFHADNPYPPHYNYRPENIPAAREADLYLIWSQRLVAKLRKDGVNAHFLAFGWDPEVTPYQGDMPQGTWPGAVFVGGWDRGREAFLDEVARHVPLKIYGPGYWGSRARRNGRARACWQGHALSGPEAAKVYREAAVSLNILRTQHIIDGQADGVIMRHFEVPGAGGVLLSTRSGVATELFPEGEAAAYFDTTQECIEKCQALISDNRRRQDLAGVGHQVVNMKHTYVVRASEIATHLRSAVQQSRTAGEFGSTLA